MSGRTHAALAVAVGGWAAMASPVAAAAATPRPVVVAATVPTNGDINPYGVAVVPRSTGRLHRGDILVSNFNAASNLQGTGTTIVEISPGGHRSLFATVAPRSLPARCSQGVGLTTALGVLRSGWVLVGSLHTRDGTLRTAQPGCVFVLDSMGAVREIISGPQIAGPWDMTVLDGGGVAAVFIANTLVGDVAGANGRVVNRGTVLRIDLAIPHAGMPRVTAMTVVGSGFAERSDPSALVVGPTGLALGSRGTLYVADAASNRIAAIPDAVHRMHTAFTGRDLTANGWLNAPLGVAVSPAGDIVSANAGDGNLVVTAPSGGQLRRVHADTSGTPGGAGTLFGLAFAGGTLYYVDDGANTLDRIGL